MSVISAGTTTTTAFKVTGDTTGTLQLQTGAVPTTAIDISATQVVTFPATTTLNFTGTLLLGDGSAAAPTLAHSGDTNTGIYFPGADQVAITTAGTQRFVVDAIGNIGVGVTPSAWASFTGFQFGAVGGLASADFGGSNVQTFFGNNIYYGGSPASFRAIKTNVSSIYRQVGKTHVWGYSESVTANNAITITEAMTLDANSKLTVGGDIAASQPGTGNVGLSIARIGGTAVDWYLYAPSGSQDLVFFRSGERARFTAAGGFALGTTVDPGAGNIMLAGLSNAIYGNATTGSRSYIEMYNTSTGDMTLGVTFSTAAIRFATGASNTERARITSDGNFVVGTTSSSRRFQASFSSSTAYSSSSMETSSLLARIVNPDGTVGNYAGIHFATANNSDAAIAGVRTADAEMAITFGTRGSGSGNIIERARITSDGNFAIGTQTTNYRLAANTSTGARNGAVIEGCTIGNSAGEYPSVGYNVRYTTSANNYTYNNTDYAVTIRYGQNGGRIETLTAASGTGGNAISFTAGPYVANLGTSWTNSSDERLKNITGEIQNGLAKVCSLRAAEFTWINDNSGKQQVGLIAQDLLKVLPEVVVVSVEEFDGTAGTAMGVNYDQTIPLLVAAIKELSAKVAALESK